MTNEELRAEERDKKKSLLDVHRKEGQKKMSILWGLSYHFKSLYGKFVLRVLEEKY